MPSFAQNVLRRAKRLFGLPHVDPELTQAMAQSPVWATARFARLLGAELRTADWGHRWVIEHLSRERLEGKVLVDLGSGVRSPVAAYYGGKVGHAYLVDLINVAEPFEGATVLASDLEQPLPLPDGSVDLVVSTSVLEHLSAEGRLLQAREIDRVLRPGGRAFVTMSYVFGLDEGAIEVLSRDTWLNEHGNRVTSRVDVAAMLDRMPNLRLMGTNDLSVFPGFDGFEERRVRMVEGLITHPIADCDWATFAPETNALGVEWAEIGVALEKVADVGDPAGSRLEEN